MCCSYNKCFSYKKKVGGIPKYAVILFFLYSFLIFFHITTSELIVAVYYLLMRRQCFNPAHEFVYKP